MAEKKSQGIWWRSVEGLEMDSDRALKLILEEIDPANPLEEEFIERNASTMLPKVVPKVDAQRLSSGKKLPDVKVRDWTV